MAQSYSAKPGDYDNLAATYTTTLLQGAVSETADVLVRRLNQAAPLKDATSLLDIGSGPGITFTKLTDISNHAKLVACDISQPMLDQIKRSGVEKVISNAQELKFANDSFSHVTAGLVLFLVPDYRQAIREIHRVLGRGGIVAASCWPRSDWQELMKLLITVNPNVAPYDISADWKTVESVGALFDEAGFVDVTAVEEDISALYSDPAQACQWLIENIPYLKDNIVDMPQDQVERLHELMISHLKQRSKGTEGKMSGKCLVVTARKSQYLGR